MPPKGTVCYSIGRAYRFWLWPRKEFPGKRPVEFMSDGGSVGVDADVWVWDGVV